jgi:hypothetical protein
MQKVEYKIATNEGFPIGARTGYVYPVEATSGDLVPFVITKIHGEWYGDHLPTGYAVQNLRSRTRAGVISIIDRKGAELADKTMEMSVVSQFENSDGVASARCP